MQKHLSTIRCSLWYACRATKIIIVLSAIPLSFMGNNAFLVFVAYILVFSYISAVIIRLIGEEKSLRYNAVGERIR
jgi:hypothetical protein